MFRADFTITIVLYLCVILKVYSSDESAVPKRVQKCRWYSPHIYLLGTPTCKSSPRETQAIEILEFPHIAIIGYRRDDDANVGIIYWDCHGTLVSSRYVLTTGHCVTNAFATPLKVRLGANEIGYSSASKSSDHDIASINVHPLYNRSTSYNDISLIKLSRKVEFSENIRPICLPESDLNPSTLYQVNYESTKRKNPVQRPLALHEQRLVPNELCNETFHRSRNLRNGITNDLMCSVKPTNLSMDYTPTREAGAPLYIDHPDLVCSHIQLGMASYGFPYGNRLPEVAIKVFYFIDWIESVIWADGEDF